MNAPVTRDAVSAPGLDRRAIIRAGANAAWIVPVVAVAGAAPALAVSGGGSLQMSGFSVLCLRSQRAIRVTVNPIKNTGQSPTGPVTVVVTVPKTRTGTFKQAPVFGQLRSAGWSYVGMTTTGYGWDYTFISDQGLQPGQSTSQLVFDIRPKNMGQCPSGDLTVTASAPNGGSSSSGAPIEDDGSGSVS